MVILAKRQIRRYAPRKREYSELLAGAPIPGIRVTTNMNKRSKVSAILRDGSKRLQEIKTLRNEVSALRQRVEHASS